MADDPNHIEIALQVTGADAAKAELTKVIDTAKADTTAAEKNRAEFAAWQAQRQAANAAAGRSSVAVTEAYQANEKAARQAAAAASNLASAEEAAFVRRRIAAQAANTAMVEEAKVRVAARAAEAAAAEKGAAALAINAFRAVTPESRVLTAATTVANNSAAVAALGGVGTAAAAMVAAVGPAIAVISTFKGELDSLREVEKLAKEAGVEMTQGLKDEMTALEATVGWMDPIKEAWGSFWKAVKNPVDTFTGLGDLKEHLQFAAEAAKKLATAKQELAKASLKKTLDEENTAIKQQFAGLQQLRELEAAHAQSGAATRQAQAAVSGTANSAGFRQSELDNKLSEQLRLADEKTALAVQEVEKISALLDANRTALQAAVQSGGADPSTEAAALIGQYRAAKIDLEDQLTTATANLEAIPAQMAEHKQQIVAEYTTELAGVRDGITEKLAAGSAALQVQLNATIAAEGESAATYQVKAARDLIAKFMENGFQPEDIKQLEEALTRIKGTKEGQDKFIKSMTDTLTEQGQSFIAAQNELRQALASANASQEANTRTLVDKINEHSARLENLTSRVR